MKRKSRRKLKYKGYIGIVIATVFIVYSVKNYFKSHNINNVLPIYSLNTYEEFQSMNIDSSNAVLKNIDNNKIVFEKDKDEKIYPASMTKIMTAIIVLENIYDLEETVLLEQNIYNDLYGLNAMTAGFSPKEQVKVIDLLYGLILPSGAECALGLSQFVAGSEEDFAKLMNKKAFDIGMESTNFINSTGLHDKNHYSTVNDFLVLLEYALNNQEFYEIFTTDIYFCEPTNLNEGGITFYSTMFSNMNNNSFDGGQILGGKTGYTKEAGQCLASLAEKNGEKYILITSGAQKKGKVANKHISDAFKIYNEIASINNQQVSVQVYKQAS